MINFPQIGRETKEFRLTDIDKTKYRALYILDKILHEESNCVITVDDSETMYIQPVLNYMVKKNLVKTYKEKDITAYIATDNGKEVYLDFRDKYSEFLIMYDVFCAVDTAQGEFAFEKFYEIEDNAEWREYLNQERWEDLRVPISYYKGLDSLEFVFMSFMNENRFEKETPYWLCHEGEQPSERELQQSWQFNIMQDIGFYIMEEVCNSAPKWEIFGKDEIENIIKYGFAVTKQLEEIQMQIDGENSDINNETEYEEVETVVEREYVEYYERYYDDWGYVSPYWRRNHIW